MNSKYFANLSIAKWLQTPDKILQGINCLEGFGGSFYFGGQLDSLENRQWSERESGGGPLAGG
jgi:hypothetical protein